MSYFIFAFILLAVMHFVYESIIAPSIRLELRFKLFKLRDELRLLKMKNNVDLDDKHFRFLQDSINHMLRTLFQLDIMTMARVKSEFDNDKAFRARVEERSKILDDCKLPEVRLIRKLSLRIAARALVVNSGAWGFYVVPIAMCVACLDVLKRVIKAFLSLTDRDSEKVVSTFGTGDFAH